MRRAAFDLFAPETIAFASLDPIFDFDARETGASRQAIMEHAFEPVALADAKPIDAAQILIDRPDVLASYYTEFYSEMNDRHSNAWAHRVGGTTPEAYALHWYETYGRGEGYDQDNVSEMAERVRLLRAVSGVEGPAKTTFDRLELTYILTNRPDVLRAYYEGYYGDGNDRHSDAWVKRVGGDTAEDYANYWYEKHGRWEGYGAGMSVASEQIDIDRLLHDRPDVFRGFYEQFYGPNNDRKSPAWVERVGGDTVQDYAKYWYVTYGQKEGYTQRPPPPEEPPPEALPPEEAQEPLPDDAIPGDETPGDVIPLPEHDPADDPWNHLDLFPGWAPPYDGWEPPASPSHAPSDADFFG